MKVKTKFLLISILFLSLSSCVRTAKCECKTTWIQYEYGNQYKHEELHSYPVKGTKKDNKTNCDIIKSESLQDNGYNTTCEVKK